MAKIRLLTGLGGKGRGSTNLEQVDVPIRLLPKALGCQAVVGCQLVHGGPASRRVWGQ